MTSPAEGLAVFFHETYERLAPSFGYETRKDTKAFDPESPNGKLMIAVCGEVLESINPNGSHGRKQNKLYVSVRLADAARTREWREVEAETLSAAIKVAEQMPDVEVCTEASIYPGGVLT